MIRLLIDLTIINKGINVLRVSVFLFKYKYLKVFKTYLKKFQNSHNAVTI